MHELKHISSSSKKVNRQKKILILSGQFLMTILGSTENEQFYYKISIVLVGRMTFLAIF